MMPSVNPLPSLSFCFLLLLLLHPLSAQAEALKSGKAFQLWRGTAFAILSRCSTSSKTHSKKTSLCMTPMQSLKPAAVPLLEAGKALAKSGELMIDMSTTKTSFSWNKVFQMTTDESGTTIISPHIAAMGACLRTAGDSIAQAAALMRFKTGHEGVVVELRDAANCFCNQLEDHSAGAPGEIRINKSAARLGVTTSARIKAEDALSEINNWIQDHNNVAAEWEQARDMLVAMIPLYLKLGQTIEVLGVRIVENASIEEIGGILLDLSKAMEALSRVPSVFGIEDKRDLINEYTQNLSKSAFSIKDAGIILGIKSTEDVDNTSKGRSWMKNGA